MQAGNDGVRRNFKFELDIFLHGKSLMQEVDRLDPLGIHSIEWVQRLFGGRRSFRAAEENEKQKKWSEATKLH
jgi:hypothetical protein